MFVLGAIKAESIVVARVARALGEADCTLIADRGLSCLTLI